MCNPHRARDTEETSAFVPWLFGIANRVVKESRRAKGRGKASAAFGRTFRPPPVEQAVSDDSLQSSIAELDESVIGMFRASSGTTGRMTCEQVPGSLICPGHSYQTSFARILNLAGEAEPPGGAKMNCTQCRESRSFILENSQCALAGRDRAPSGGVRRMPQ